jgi:tetratricopeptide (TPR) repeat protein
MKNNFFRMVGGIALIGALTFCGGCRTGRGPAGPAIADPELARLMDEARAAVAAGSPVVATELYQTALRRARVMDESESIARIAYNLGICRAMAGQNTEARAALLEARAESQPGSELDGLTWLAEARVLRGEGRPRDAWQVLETARLRFGDREPKSLRGAIHLLAAGIKADLQDNEAARDELTLAVTWLAKTGTDPRLAAEAAGLDGELLTRDNNFADAARAYDREADQWRTSRNYEALSAALARAGEAYRRAGQDGSAADRYFRAARSRLNSGAKQTPEIKEWVVRAKECAEKSGRTDLVERLGK